MSALFTGFKFVAQIAAGVLTGAGLDRVKNWNQNRKANDDPIA